jgi:hypothetical protein
VYVNAGFLWVNASCNDVKGKGDEPDEVRSPRFTATLKYFLNQMVIIFKRETTNYHPRVLKIKLLDVVAHVKSDI